MSTNLSTPSFERFIRERQMLHNISPATAEWHRQSLNWLAIEQPTQKDLNDFVCRLREARMSPASCNNRIRSVNSYLHWSAMHDFAASGSDGFETQASFDSKCGSGCRHLRCSKLKEPQNVVTTYTPDQIKMLIGWKPAAKNFYQRRL
ncbi:MAG: hypothetical protein ACLPVW_10005 [Terriglobales bacterium]